MFRQHVDAQLALTVEIGRERRAACSVSGWPMTGVAASSWPEKSTGPSVSLPLRPSGRRTRRRPGLLAPLGWITRCSPAARASGTSRRLLVGFSRRTAASVRRLAGKRSPDRVPAGGKRVTSG